MPAAETPSWESKAQALNACEASKTPQSETQNGGEADEYGGGFRSFFREWRGFFLFVALMLVFRSVIADWNHVPSGSMRPTLLIGDRVVVNKLAFDLRVPFTFIKLWQHSDPQRGDIITFESPKDSKLLIKRVVGVPGDRIELRDNNLYVNGIPASYRSLSAKEIEPLQMPDANNFDILQETALGHTRYTLREHLPRSSGYRSFRAIDVPQGKYLVLGDNRDNSGDFRDREVGFVARDVVLGRAHSVAFSLNYDNSYLPRSGRYFESLTLNTTN